MHRRGFLRCTSAAAATWVLGCRPEEELHRDDRSAGTGESPVPGEAPATPPVIESNPSDPAPAPELDGEFPEWTLGTESSSANTVLMFRGNPSHTFYGTGPLRERPELAWRSKLGEARGVRADGSLYHWLGTGWTGQPVLWGHRVYIGALDGKLYCFDTQSGATIWAYDSGGMFKGSCCFYAGRKLSTSLRPVGTEFSEQEELSAQLHRHRSKAC